MTTRTWKEILDSGELTNDLPMTELEEAIGRSEDEYYIRGFAEGMEQGLRMTETNEQEEVRRQRDWLLKEVREGYGNGK